MTQPGMQERLRETNWKWKARIDFMRRRFGRIIAELADIDPNLYHFR